MRRPSLQFYPGDWQSNPKLRRCSHAEKGVWLDVLCILHDQDEYGVIRWPLKDLARAVNAPLRVLQCLVEKGVLKGSESGECTPFIYVPRHARKDGNPVTLITAQSGPIWYSSRMVRDEYVRNTAGASTRFTAGDQSQEARPRRSTSAGTERARLRQAVSDKTGGYCFHCKVPLDTDWQIDHFIPRSKGGSNAFSNLVPSCKQCNQDKCDTMPSDWVAPSRAHGERRGPHPSRARASSSTSSSTSSSASTSGLEQKHPAKKQRDERLDHPALAAVLEIRGAYPPKELWDLVIEKVGVNPDAARMKECWLEWRTRNYSPMAYGWLMDWYFNGIHSQNGGRREAGQTKADSSLAAAGRVAAKYEQRS